MITAGELLEMFESMNRSSVDEEGIKIPHAIYEKDGQLTACALALPPGEIYMHIARILVRERPGMLVFGMDRFVLPGQSIDTADALSVSFWTGNRWRFGVIPYDFKLGRFGPTEWNNSVWMEMLNSEMSNNWSHIKNAPHREPSPAMLLPLLTDWSPSEFRNLRS